MPTKRIPISAQRQFQLACVRNDCLFSMSLPWMPVSNRGAIALDCEPMKISMLGVSCIGTAMVMKAGKPCHVCTEEQWRNRAPRRFETIKCMKESIEYSAAADSLVRPRTPDPRNQTISKRGWDKAVYEWRHALRRMTLQ